MLSDESLRIRPLRLSDLSVEYASSKSTIRVSEHWDLSTVHVSTY